MTLQELGLQAYQKAVFADYNGAVQILDKAIAKFPKDEKLLNNRSFCFLKMKDYKRALEDAEKMIKQFPRYTKSYYRKAEVLIALKRYVEAEQFLNMLLQIDPNCIEAQETLNQVKSQNTVRRVSNLASLDNSSRVLSRNTTSTSTSTSTSNLDDVYFSDEDLSKMLDLALSLSSTNKKKKKKKGTA